jgi:hypothetical protein
MFNKAHKEYLYVGSILICKDYRAVPDTKKALPA